jgi:hypothetical protein
LSAAPAFAKRGISGPPLYIQGDGFFYIKGIPPKNGCSGDPSGAKTLVMRVQREQDAVMDSYDWYEPNPKAVKIQWNGETGRVDLIRVAVQDINHCTEDEYTFARNAPLLKIELFSGGKLVKSYDRKALDALGLPAHVQSRSVGIEAAPSYDQKINHTGFQFKVRLAKDVSKTFDAETGKPLD